MAEVTVASWNILLDDVYPQEERIKSIIDTLQEVNRTHALGALGIMEAQATALGHSGRMIARELFGNDGEWQLHSRKKHKEHIGVAGPNIANTEFIDLGYSKFAALTHVEDIAVATVHLRRQRGPEQVAQMGALLDRLDDEPHAVVMGDFNGLKLHKPRRLVWQSGYRSVFTEAGVSRHRTVPTKNFESMAMPMQRLGMFVIRGGVNVDDIYVKGVEVKTADYFEGESDHLGVVATVESTAP